MISGVRLALSVIVGIVPRATGRPSSGRNWRGPSNIAAVPPIVGGDIGFFRPKCLQADERRNGKWNEGGEDGLLSYETDGKVRQGSEGSDFHFRRDQQRQHRFQHLLPAPTYK